MNHGVQWHVPREGCLDVYTSPRFRSVGDKEAAGPDLEWLDSGIHWGGSTTRGQRSWNSSGRSEQRFTLEKRIPELGFALSPSHPAASLLHKWAWESLSFKTNGRKGGREEERDKGKEEGGRTQNRPR